LTDAGCLPVTRLVALLVGVAGTGAALVMAATDIRTIYSIVIEFMGVLGGTLSGLFVLGIFSRRASGKGALAGARAVSGSASRSRTRNGSVCNWPTH